MASILNQHVINANYSRKIESHYILSHTYVFATRYVVFRLVSYYKCRGTMKMEYVV